MRLPDIQNHLSPIKYLPKGFKGTPNKIRKFDQLSEIDSGNKLVEKVPVGFKNLGQNVCFFNSVIQVLYSVDLFREHILSVNTLDPVVLMIKELFRVIELSNTPIETYQYIQSLELPNYDHTLKQQFDL